MSGAVWVIGGTVDGRLAASSPGVATLARRFAAAGGREIAGITVGPRAQEAAQELAAYVPVAIAVPLPPESGWATPSMIAAIVADLVAERGPSHLVIPATQDGKELAGALAARLQWGVLGNAVDLTWDGATGKPIVHSVIFRDDLRVQSGFTADHGLITVQPNVVAPARDGVGTVETIPALLAAAGGMSGAPGAAIKRVERVTVPAPTSVEGARIVVAGGAGIGSAEAWGVVESLAGALHAAVGSSRPPVDAGWVPMSQQIGQTGKSVRPDLYVALGISGEIQHRVGMRTSRTVIAVNIDPEAPIRQVADLFVVGDVHVIVPELVAAIGSRGS